MTGGVVEPSLTLLLPTENLPTRQNLQGDFRQRSLSFFASLFHSVPYIMNTINLCGVVRVGSRSEEPAGRLAVSDSD